MRFYKRVFQVGLACKRNGIWLYIQTILHGMHVLRHKYI